MDYRGDIDCLRAFAVMAVIVFHYFPFLAPNGFLGVDIFFVISGFLITNIVFYENGQKLGIAHFYDRRIRRIFP